MTTRRLRVIRVVLITLLVSILQSLVLAQAINDPTSHANIDIRASHITSNFASETNSGRYYTNPDTNKEYYLIGSTDQRHEQTAPNINTSFAANKTGTIQLAPNVTSPTADSKTEAIQPVTNKTVSITINTYNTLIIIEDNKTNTTQQVTNKTTKKTIGKSDGPSSDPMPEQTPTGSTKTSSASATGGTDIAKGISAAEGKIEKIRKTAQQGSINS